jgi:NADH:ubiquinone oxidoreductase subunit F (NADH-binding)/NAD-dependent dihydropyrimidine dehydrogenase PreA subunit
MMAQTLAEIKDMAWWELVKRLNETPDEYNIGHDSISLKGDYYQLQERIALRNIGIINPDSIEEYIATDGYFALQKALLMKPEEVVKVVKDSGLRGRGGAGFSAGRKWESAAKQQVEQKYVICNADEGDPGAYMDRSILEGDPHSVLEGMAICGYAIGANKGYIYVRAEYPKAVSSLINAIDQAQKLGVLGDNILDSGFDFHIELRLGAGAFVCGESTALMESIEGKRGMPRNKEFRTTERGLWGKPTVINNVETLANVAPIINKGADWFSAIGTPLSAGTKVFALVGKVNHPGLVEVPMGMSIYDIVYKIGGGIPDGKKAKAVQTGGPSGGCIPSKMWDTKVDFESLEEVGSIMGSGGMVVMDEKDCMVDIAKFFLEFSVDESCGKCTPCRIGNKRLLELLEKFTEGEADYTDINKLKNLSNVICTTSLCGLGQSSPNPVLSTLNYFYDEYKEHAEDKHCRSGVCKQLLRYEVNERCVGCTRCLQHCPVDCITGAIRERHYIDSEKCIRCGECFNNCPVDAITVY